MASRHLLVLPAQELAELQLAAAQSPQFAYLLKKLPCFAAALDHPLPDVLEDLTRDAREAAFAVQANTRHPETWNALLAHTAALEVAMRAVTAAQDAALATPDKPADPATTCQCCGSSRYAHASSRGVDQNELRIPHLGFAQEDGYLPSGLGIPGGSDGICIKVCLECGHVRNGSYPLSDDSLKSRIEEAA